jgi:alanine racemase
MTELLPPHAHGAHIAVSLDNVIHNLGEIRRIVPPAAGIMAVVKDNAYGCGSVMIGRILERHGVSYLAVASAREARVLRDGGVTLPVLIFGPSIAEDIAWGANNNIVFSLNDLGDIDEWKHSGAVVRFHIAVDTGMGRLGILPDQAQQTADALKEAPGLNCEGIYTHCANADVQGTATVAQQLATFRRVRNILAGNGISPHHVHYANSAALLRFPPDPACTLARPGIALYGCKPDPVQDFGISLKPVVSLKAYVVKVKRVPPGTAVSYGGRYVTKSETHITTVSIGYGAGYPRRLSNKGVVLVGGRRYGIAGTVTMDYIMVDTGLSTDIRVGDEAVVLGCQGDDCITADEIAAQANTIGYEILCGLNRRIDRYYYLGGKVVHFLPGQIF